MSQVTYNSEKIAKKKVVFYNDTGGSVTLRGGYALSYDYSQTDLTQAYRVVRPASANFLWFAGALTEEYDSKVVANGATLNVEIYVPTKYGQVVPVWITENHSANMALLEITDDSFAFTEGSSQKVVRTVGRDDRGTINGVTLARLYGLTDPLA